MKKELIKFKSMQEILLTEAAYFDKYGNLCVNNIHARGEVEHLAPTYFSYLGKLREFNNETHFPWWCIEYTTGNTFPMKKALETLKETVSEDDREIVEAALNNKLTIRHVGKRRDN